MNTDTYSAVQLKVGVVVLGMEDATLDAFPVDLTNPSVMLADKATLADEVIMLVPPEEAVLSDLSLVEE